MSGKIGDKVGYAVMKQNQFGQWLETDCPTMDTIGHAVGMVRHYQQARPETTYAVARLELVMISWPDPAKDPEGLALVQAIHDRKNNH